MNGEISENLLSLDVNLDELAKYRTDSLFLLIGTNPLPNYVVFHLLEKPACHVYLVHTSETGKIANRLVDVLKLPDESWTKIPVDESDANNIFTQIYRYAEGNKGLGLNYTGGTKSMAVHSYRAIQAADPDAVFSYLDARRLELTINQSDRSFKRVPVALSIKPPIETLLALHGHTTLELKRDPFQPEVCLDLIKVPHTELRPWCDNNLRSGPDTDIRKNKVLKTVQLPLFKNLTGHWDKCANLSDLADMWSKKTRYLAKWFDGRWLEHYTLWAVQQVSQKNKVHDAVISLESKERDFEIDVVALRGYQLYGISCTTIEKKAQIKQKLFEAYIRARQLGGDEARVGVVSFAPANDPDNNPAKIKKEIEEDWDAKGKFRVYGVEDIPNLPAHLQEWFNSQ